MAALLFRLLALLGGLSLLLLLLPQRDPWTSARLRTPGGSEATVSIDLPALSEPLEVSAWSLLAAAALLLAARILSSDGARRKLAGVARSPRAAAALAVPLALFLVTLYPSTHLRQVLGVLDGPEPALPVVLYLLLGGLAMLLLLSAGYRALLAAAERPSLAALRHRVWQPARRFVLELAPGRFAALVSLVALGLSAAGSYFLFERVPHVQDNINQLFHARIFLSGRLTADSHPLPQFFDFLHMINDGRWYSVYPPGHTLMLALGLLAGAPWLVNPVLGALTVVLLFLLGREVYDEATGRLAALLGLASPWVIFMAASFFSNVTALFCTVLFAYLFARTLRARSLVPPALAGAALGLGFLARPLTAVGVALPYALYALYLMVFRRRKGAHFVVMAAVFFLFLGALLGFNYLTTGDPLLTAYEVLYGEGMKPGFGGSGWGPPHTPARGLVHALENLNGLQRSLFEWVVPSTIFVLLLFWHPDRRPWDRLLLASAGSLVLVYFFYWYNDWCMGPRFLFEASGPLILLSARGIRTAPETMRLRFGSSLPAPRIASLVTAVVLVLVVLALAANVPVLVRHYGNDFWGVNTRVQQAVRERGLRNALVFVESYYAALFAENAPTLDGEIVYALHLGTENRLLMRHYPERRAYLADGFWIRELHPMEYEEGEPAVPNGGFESGTLSGWRAAGSAWGVTARERGEREGEYHAESLHGGEAATGRLRSAPFTVSGRWLAFRMNGWDGNPERPNVYLLRDAATGSVLRSAAPPNHDPLVRYFWDVADLRGRVVRLVVLDRDDDFRGIGGYAWLGVDDLRQIP